VSSTFKAVPSSMSYFLRNCNGMVICPLLVTVTVVIGTREILSSRFLLYLFAMRGPRSTTSKQTSIRQRDNQRARRSHVHNEENEEITWSGVVPNTFEKAIHKQEMSEATTGVERLRASKPRAAAEPRRSADRAMPPIARYRLFNRPGIVELRAKELRRVPLQIGPKE